MTPDTGTELFVCLSDVNGLAVVVVEGVTPPLGVGPLPSLVVDLRQGLLQQGSKISDRFGRQVSPRWPTVGDFRHGPPSHYRQRTNSVCPPRRASGTRRRAT